MWQNGRREPAVPRSRPRSRPAPRRRAAAASRGCSRPRARRRRAARARRSARASSRKPSSVTCMSRERVVDVRVEAGGDEQQVGLERAHRRLDHLGERAQVLVVAGAGRQRHVERRLVARPRPAGARIERPLVQRDEEDGVVAAEDRLGAVAVVDVEVDDRDALEPELGLRVARRDGDVVEEAEAHRPVGERVVAGRADEREAAAVDRLERDPGGERARPPSSSRRRSCPASSARAGRSRAAARGGRRVRTRSSCSVARDRSTVSPAEPAAAGPAAPDGRRSGGAARAPGSSGARQRLQPAGEPAEAPLVARAAAARAQVGSWSSSGGSGASASIVAMRR